MRVNTDKFNALWMRTHIGDDFGTLVIEHHDNRNWVIHGALMPRGQEGLIEKAQWHIDNTNPKGEDNGHY